MFVDDISTRESLSRMVRKVTANRALREDLLQEGLVHLWITEIGAAVADQKLVPAELQISFVALFSSRTQRRSRQT
jgi:hypothetical protein